jgi:hypothetical protein
MFESGPEEVRFRVGLFGMATFLWLLENFPKIDGGHDALQALFAGIQMDAKWMPQG